MKKQILTLMLAGAMVAGLSTAVAAEGEAAALPGCEKAFKHHRIVSFLLNGHASIDDEIGAIDVGSFL